MNRYNGASSSSDTWSISSPVQASQDVTWKYCDSPVRSKPRKESALHNQFLDTPVRIIKRHVSSPLPDSNSKTLHHSRKLTKLVDFEQLPDDSFDLSTPDYNFDLTEDELTNNIKENEKKENQERLNPTSSVRTPRPVKIPERPVLEVPVPLFTKRTSAPCLSQAQSTQSKAQSTQSKAQSTQSKAQSTQSKAQSTQSKAQSTEHKSKATQHKTQALQPETKVSQPSPIKNGSIDFDDSFDNAMLSSIPLEQLSSQATSSKVEIRFDPVLKLSQIVTDKASTSKPTPKSSEKSIFKNRTNPVPQEIPLNMTQKLQIAENRRLALKRLEETKKKQNKRL